MDRNSSQDSEASNLIDKSETLHVFPTPIVTARLTGYETINRTLRAIILDHETRNPGEHHSNLGGWQSRPDFGRWGGPMAIKVLDAARQLAVRYTVDRQGRTVNIDWRVGAWANVNRRGHGNEFHTHPGVFWSGVYYVDDGGVANNPKLGGEFEVRDPRGVAPVMYAPLLTIAGPAGPSLGGSEVLRPWAGTMILFPSWLSHGVRPYNGDAVRISIAFNLALATQ